MIRLVLVSLLLMSSSAWAQTRKNASVAADPCAPIGRTADGQLVYSMKCNNLPTPTLPPQARREEAPAPEPEIQRSGIFGLSYTRKPASE